MRCDTSSFYTDTLRSAYGLFSVLATSRVQPLQMATRALLRVKRRRDEDAAEALGMIAHFPGHFLICHIVILCLCFCQLQYNENQ